jgi:hypothetical protein
MKEINAAEIERINVGILVIGSLLALVVMRDFSYLFSFAVGSAVMTMNFRLLRKIIEGGLTKGTASKKGFLIKLPLKFLGLIGVVFVVVVYGDISVVFFLIGLSTVFLSIIISQIISVFQPVTKRSQNDGT